MSTANIRQQVIAPRLKAGETIYGTFMMLQSGWTARTVATVGWDFVLIDCEHGNIGDSDMHESVTGVAASGSAPIVRIRNADVGLVKRALDTGAHGIMVPLVNTPEEARLVVQAAKFPPIGIRGQGSPFSSWASNLGTPDYVQSANERLLTIVQIETLQAVENVDAIAAVGGVDCLFIGPNDLALGFLGYAPPQWTEPEYLALIDTVVAACRKANKPCGILMPDGEKAKWAKEKWGIQVMAMGTDVKAIQLWMGAQLAAAKT